jgi:KDO2-lipid IV(A) lauroyltransferase
MFAATHSGSWDVAAAAMTQRYASVMTVAERLKPERLYQMFTKSRERFNFNIIPHVGGDRPPTEILTERLMAGGLVGLASDRDLKGRGVKVDMFGHPVRLPLGAVRLARATGAALLPAAVFYEGDVTVMRILPEIDFSGLNERQGYEALARAFEEILSAHPEAWHMLQPVWLDHPSDWGVKN